MHKRENKRTLYQLNYAIYFNKFLENKTYLCNIIKHI